MRSARIWLREQLPAVPRPYPGVRASVLAMQLLTVKRKLVLVGDVATSAATLPRTIALPRKSGGTRMRPSTLPLGGGRICSTSFALSRTSARSRCVKMTRSSRSARQRVASPDPIALERNAWKPSAPRSSSVGGRIRSGPTRAEKSGRAAPAGCAIVGHFCSSSSAGGRSRVPGRSAAGCEASDLHLAEHHLAIHGPGKSVSARNASAVGWGARPASRGGNRRSVRGRDTKSQSHAEFGCRSDRSPIQLDQELLPCDGMRIPDPVPAHGKGAASSEWLSLREWFSGRVMVAQVPSCSAGDGAPYRASRARKGCPVPRCASNSRSQNVGISTRAAMISPPLFPSLKLLSTDVGEEERRLAVLGAGPRSRIRYRSVAASRCVLPEPTRPERTNPAPDGLVATRARGYAPHQAPAQCGRLSLIVALGPEGRKAAGRVMRGNPHPAEFGDTCSARSLQMTAPAPRMTEARPSD